MSMGFEMGGQHKKFRKCVEKLSVHQRNFRAPHWKLSSKTLLSVWTTFAPLSTGKSQPEIQIFWHISLNIIISIPFVSSVECGRLLHSSPYLLFDELGQKKINIPRRFTSTATSGSDDPPFLDQIPDSSISKINELEMNTNSVSETNYENTSPAKKSREGGWNSETREPDSVSDSLKFPDDNFSLEVTRLKILEEDEIEPVTEISSEKSNKTLDFDKRNKTLQQKGSNVASEAPCHSGRSSGIAQAGDKNFLLEFYGNSRLHHISMWGAQFKQLVKKFNRAPLPNAVNWNDVSDDMVTNAMGLLNHRCKPICWAPQTLHDDGHEESSEKVLAHIDLDCFFVSVGLLKHPELRGLPVAVTHSKGKGPRDESSADTNDGGQDGTNILKSYAEIASCSYEARAKGVRNGMLMKNAIQLCPDLKTIQYDFQEYHRIAVILYNTVARYSTTIQAVSCDECFVDITNCVKNSGGLNPCNVASLISAEVFDKTGCHASVGISSNMLLARLSTKSAKPNGVFSLDSNRKDQLFRYLDSLPVDGLPGVGFSSHQQLKNLGILNVGHLRIRDLDELRSILGSKTGETLFNFSRGVDPRELNSIAKRKSVSAEINYGIRLNTQSQVESFVEELVEEVHRRLCECEMLAKSICLKLRIRAQDQPKETKKFLGCGICDSVNKSKNFLSYTNNLSVIKREVAQILKNIKFEASDLRGVGVTLNKLTDESDEKSPSKFQDIAKMFSNHRKNVHEKCDAATKCLVFPTRPNMVSGHILNQEAEISKNIQSSSSKQSFKSVALKKTDSLWEKASHKGHLYGQVDDIETNGTEAATLRDEINGSDSEESVIDIQARDHGLPAMNQSENIGQSAGKSKNDLNSKLMKFQKLKNKAEKLLKQQSAHCTSDAAKLAPADRITGFDVLDEMVMDLDDEETAKFHPDGEYPKFGPAENVDEACKIIQQWLKTPSAR